MAFGTAMACLWLYELVAAPVRGRPAKMPDADAGVERLAEAV